MVGPTSCSTAAFPDIFFFPFALGVLPESVKFLPGLRRLFPGGRLFIYFFRPMMFTVFPASLQGFLVACPAFLRNRGFLDRTRVVSPFSSWSDFWTLVSREGLAQGQSGCSFDATFRFEHSFDSDYPLTPSASCVVPSSPLFFMFPSR